MLNVQAKLIKVFSFTLLAMQASGRLVRRPFVASVEHYEAPEVLLNLINECLVPKCQ